MLTESGDVLHVELIECYDAIDGLRPCSIAHGVNQILQGKLFRHGEYFVDRFEWPVGVAKFLDGQEKNAAAGRLASADELLTLFVGTDTQDSERLALRRKAGPRTPRAARDALVGPHVAEPVGDAVVDFGDTPVVGEVEVVRSAVPTRV